MKRIFLVVASLLLSATASATTEKWTAGWDNFSEPLNFTSSNITWSVSATTRKLTVTFNLVGATHRSVFTSSAARFLRRSASFQAAPVVPAPRLHGKV